MSGIINTLKKAAASGSNLQRNAGVPEFSPEMRFSIEPLPGDSGFSQWHSAMKMVSQLPEGIPSEFRRRLWLSLADKHLFAKGIDWAKVERNCFSEWSHPADAELGVQIVKDLHRTGCSLFCGKDGQENQALLKRVLLAYARWNKAVGYCQGFNMLAALILQVTEKCETDALKLMIYLIEGVLPDSYFADSLRGLSIDMAVFRELLRTKLPRLSRHLDTLQVASKEGTTSYEPPLTNVFTMQWFLTLFCNCLPQPTVLRVWDLILLEGNEILLRTSLAIWQVLADRIMAVKSADEFYCVMGVLMREILEYDLIEANTLIKGIVSIGPLTELNNLRDHYLYNINPWGGSIPTTDPDRRMKVYHKDRLVLDIGVLKKQYTKLKQRQRQAHIIFNTAVARQTGRAAPIAMNHLLLGKSALVPAKRLGPPKGAVPPARQPPPPKTLHWKDTRKDSSSSSSSSSSDTELCDDPGGPSSDEEEPKCQLDDDNLSKQSDKTLMIEDNTIGVNESAENLLDFQTNDLLEFEVSEAVKTEEDPPKDLVEDNQTENKRDIFDTDDGSNEIYNKLNMERSDSITSEDGFDFEKFLEERVKSFKEKTFSSEESIEETSELERVKYARKNSVRALEIIQENSLILHRILQCQSRLTPTPPPVEKDDDFYDPSLFVDDITPTNDLCVAKEVLEFSCGLPESSEIKEDENLQFYKDEADLNVEMKHGISNEMHTISDETLKFYSKEKVEIQLKNTISDETLKFNSNDEKTDRTKHTISDEKLTFYNNKESNESTVSDSKVQHTTSDETPTSYSNIKANDSKRSILDEKSISECNTVLDELQDTKLEATSPGYSPSKFASDKKLTDVSNQETFKNTSTHDVLNKFKLPSKQQSFDEKALQSGNSEEHDTFVCRGKLETQRGKLTAVSSRSKSMDQYYFTSRKIVDKKVVAKSGYIFENEDALEANEGIGSKLEDASKVVEVSKKISEDITSDITIESTRSTSMDDIINKYKSKHQSGESYENIPNDNIVFEDKQSLKQHGVESYGDILRDNKFEDKEPSKQQVVESYGDILQDNKFVEKKSSQLQIDESSQKDYIVFEDESSSKQELGNLHKSNVEFEDKFSSVQESNKLYKSVSQHNEEFKDTKEESNGLYKSITQDKDKLSSKQKGDESYKNIRQGNDVFEDKLSSQSTQDDAVFEEKLETVNQKDNLTTQTTRSKSIDDLILKYNVSKEILDAKSDISEEITRDEELIEEPHVLDTLITSSTRSASIDDIINKYSLIPKDFVDTITVEEEITVDKNEQLIKTTKNINQHETLESINDELSSTKIDHVQQVQAIIDVSDLKVSEPIRSKSIADLIGKYSLVPKENVESIPQGVIEYDAKVEAVTEVTGTTDSLRSKSIDDLIGKYNFASKEKAKEKEEEGFQRENKDEGGTLIDYPNQGDVRSKSIDDIINKYHLAAEDSVEEVEENFKGLQKDNDYDLVTKRIVNADVKDVESLRKDNKELVANVPGLIKSGQKKSSKDEEYNLSEIVSTSKVDTKEKFSQDSSDQKSTGFEVGVTFDVSKSGIVDKNDSFLQKHEEEILGNREIFQNHSKEGLTKLNDLGSVEIFDSKVNTSIKVDVHESFLHDHSGKSIVADKDSVEQTLNTRDSILETSIQLMQSKSKYNLDSRDVFKPEKFVVTDDVEQSYIREVDYNLEKYRHKLGSPLAEDQPKEDKEELIEIAKNSKYNSILEYSRDLDEKFNNLILKTSKTDPKSSSDTSKSTELPAEEKPFFEDRTRLDLLKSPDDPLKSPKSPNGSPSNRSPNRTLYSPFPVAISSRQNKEVAVRLGLYKK